MDREFNSTVGPHDTLNSIMKRIKSNFPKSTDLQRIASYAAAEYMIPIHTALCELVNISVKERWSE